MKNRIQHWALVAAGLFATAGLAQATLITYNSSPTLDASIPDGNPVGTTFSDTVSGSSGAVSDVDVNLDISGGYNGDLYGYLVYNNGSSSSISILLNRVGATTSNPAGYSDGGMNVTLSGVGVNDVHLYQNFTPTYNGSGQLTGTWAADGSTQNPSSATGANQTAGLTVFNGQSSANGTWTLFLADMSVGGQSTLVNWGLDITVVPEPITWALLGFAGILGVAKLRSVRAARKTA